MTCIPGTPVRLGVQPVATPHPRFPDATITQYLGGASCGWHSRSIGTEDKAWGWSRQHALLRHGDGTLLPCEGPHIENRRTGFCRACDTDMWPEDRRQEWAISKMGDQVW